MDFQQRRLLTLTVALFVFYHTISWSTPALIISAICWATGCSTRIHPAARPTCIVRAFGGFGCHLADLLLERTETHSTLQHLERGIYMIGHASSLLIFIRRLRFLIAFLFGLLDIEANLH